MGDPKNRIPGLIIEEEIEDYRKELNKMINNVIIILELKGFSQPYAFNITNNETVAKNVVVRIDVGVNLR